MGDHYITVTEVANTEVSLEQVQRICSRYHWAAEFCLEKDVLEVACGTGQGLAYLKVYSHDLCGGDISPQMTHFAKENNPEVFLNCLDALFLPYPNEKFDVVILFEALYYLKDFPAFLKEVNRVLKPEGKLLLATANPDLYDFNPSPFSFKYYGLLDLKKILMENRFNARFFGDFPTYAISFKQKLIRPIKKFLVLFGLVPKTMKGKKFFKKIIFGKLVNMPSKLTEELVKSFTYSRASIPDDKPDTSHKVILCLAQKI